MSISTSSICTYCSQSSSGMSGLPTPRTAKSAAEHHTREGARKQNQVEGWRRELLDKINIYDGSIDSYLDNFVPARTECPITPPADASLASKLKPRKGREVANYEPLMNIFEALQAEFPKEKKLSFYDCHKQPIPFPFAAHANKHTMAKPDIAVSFPGGVLPKKMTSPDWSGFSMVIEAKATAKEDPFEGRDGLVYADALAQLAINARSIMYAHGLLATFMIGIYGDVVRIARFDHACAVATPALSLKTPEGLAAIQRFFWNFVHPWEGAIVGADTTMRKLTEEDEEWLKGEHGLGKLRAKTRLRGVKLRSEGRWTKVYDKENPKIWKAFFLFKLLDINTRLFSRATMVWLGIEDTRTSAEPGKPKLRPPLRIIKEAWRQVIRISEDQFYDRLEETIDDEEWCGLPKLLHGCDLGVRDVARWDAARAGKQWEGDDDLLEMQSVASDSASSETSSAPSSLFSATASSTSSPTGSEVSDVDPAEPSIVPSSSAARRLPHPMHQTYSWRLSRGRTHHAYERSHMRFVVDTVGLPLSEFRNTKELAMAIRDAIKGHRLMMERGGVLHRDVSSGNILIVEEPQERPSSKGILHDYDYSSMTLDPPGKASMGVSAEPPPLRPLELSDQFADVATCKERMGTYYFIALDLVRPEMTVAAHDSPHDLESFFWVLLWIVLRHTKHGHEDNEEPLCARTFIAGKDGAAADAKLAWLDRSDVFDVVLAIPGNPALSNLLNDFHALVWRANKGKINDRIPLTYNAVLHIFDTAIERDDWPVGDKAIPYKLIELRTWESLIAKTDSKSQAGDRRPRTLEDDGVSSDSGDGDEDEDEVELAMAAKRPKRIPTRLRSNGPTAGASTIRAQGAGGSGSRSTKGASEQGPKAAASGGKGKARDVSGA
ncbi:hypothetical protein TRAPUB_2881 [Trametes pubescens]|uniref:Fungal-type protein kinase domain-containing protein n=1 Tax=Trametes pubescens TaxID=154538 RepID=A0A1M2VFF6_TRAPU|nr:hypothetical protein TRAPUB_2881 [Trametes pubescens]